MEHTCQGTRGETGAVWCAVRSSHPSPERYLGIEGRDEMATFFPAGPPAHGQYLFCHLSSILVPRYRLMNAPPGTGEPPHAQKLDSTAHFTAIQQRGEAITLHYSRPSAVVAVSKCPVRPQPPANSCTTLGGDVDDLRASSRFH